MLIARLIADPAGLETRVDRAVAAIEAADMRIAKLQMLDFCDDVLQFALPEGDPARLRTIIDDVFAPCDLLVSPREIVIPQVFVSDMDSTMIGQECIDELADFAGLKDHVAAITERAMRGELDFESALRQRVSLLADLDEGVIATCLAERIRPMIGAEQLVRSLNAAGCRTILVTGGFHHFADPVAEWLGFGRVVANRLALQGGKLIGALVGPIVDSAVKREVLLEEVAAAGKGAVSLATGDGANDVPMLKVADFGFAYHAKPKARSAANGVVDRGDLTAILKLLEIPAFE